MSSSRLSAKRSLSVIDRIANKSLSVLLYSQFFKNVAIHLIINLNSVGHCNYSIYIYHHQLNENLKSKIIENVFKSSFLYYFLQRHQKETTNAHVHYQICKSK